MTGPLWCTAEIDIVSQLYFNKKKNKLISPTVKFDETQT